MAVYVDALRKVEPRPGWRFRYASHMVADSLVELHEFAERIGMRAEWFQLRGSTPHYDLTPRSHAAALKHGAIELDRPKFVEVLRRLRYERQTRLSCPIRTREFAQLQGPKL